MSNDDGEEFEVEIGDFVSFGFWLTGWMGQTVNVPYTEETARATQTPSLDVFVMHLQGTEGHSGRLTTGCLVLPMDALPTMISTMQQAQLAVERGEHNPLGMPKDPFKN